MCCAVTLIANGVVICGHIGGGVASLDSLALDVGVQCKCLRAHLRLDLGGRRRARIAALLGIYRHTFSAIGRTALPFNV